jgi:hypothetical protein
MAFQRFVIRLNLPQIGYDFIGLFINHDKIVKYLVCFFKGSHFHPPYLLPLLLKPLFINILPLLVIVEPLVIVTEFKLSKADCVAVLMGFYKSVVLSILSKFNDSLVTSI